MFSASPGPARVVRIGRAIMNVTPSVARRLRRFATPFLSVAALGLAASAHAAPGVASNGKVDFGILYSQTDGDSHPIGISSDGRYVAYFTWATNVMLADGNAHVDVYRYDRLLASTLMMSVNVNGVSGNGPVNEGYPVVIGRQMTPDGRYVLFTTQSSDIVAGDTNGKADAFVRDTNGLGSTLRVSVGSGGAQLAGDSTGEAISADGQKVLFSTTAGISAKDTNGTWDLYLYNRYSNTTTLISTKADGTACGAHDGSMTDDGSAVAFVTSASLVAADTNNQPDVYWRSTSTPNGMWLASATSAGAVGNSYSSLPDISGDGTKIAFESTSSNLVANDTNTRKDVFVKNVSTKAIARVSTTSTGAQTSNGCWWPTLTTTGSYISMLCIGSDFGEPVQMQQTYIKDLTSGAVTRVSQTTTGIAQNGAGFAYPQITDDGSQVTFSSIANDLVTPDDNGKTDVFVGSRQ
jgi:hypothetical protein